ncbi:MAG: aminomethyl-transferring glycine dehydrogenase subunit GcvPA [Candidatus Gastranaerophilales bacterium]|nr:aminomethyl-transferring glycine dehydrogenase subunit GcvPA [Candidatus Gastranaerophilales bacterium]
MKNFLPHTDQIRNQLAKEANLDSIDSLFDSINDSVKFKNDLNLPDGISELEAQKKLKKLANKNNSDCINFLGGGTYNKFIPACISAITSRTEFLTSYTPYQPEASQGTLQAMYEYQSMICNLTGMDVSNASVYDGATACAEAVLMVCRISKKSKVLIAETLNQQYLQVIKTYCFGGDIEVKIIPEINGEIDFNYLSNLTNIDEFAAILIQTPNYFGNVENSKKIGDFITKNKLKLIVCADISSLAVLEVPVNFGADIVVGDIQTLGIPMAFGGPHAGYMACKQQYARQLPGRIVGMTLDKAGNRAYTLTLQTREQHIKREKATSNICSNQALVALAATIYLSVMGYNGLKQAILLSAQKAKNLSEKINNIKGFKVLYNNFLYEFVVKVDEKISVEILLNELKENNILAGINLKKYFKQYKNSILVCTTEMNTDKEIDFYIEKLQEISTKYNLEDV